MKREICVFVIFMCEWYSNRRGRYGKIKQSRNDAKKTPSIIHRAIYLSRVVYQLIIDIWHSGWYDKFS